MGKRERYKISTSVFVFLIKDGKILLIKRANTGWMDGFYSVPAGAIDGNETLTSAAIREANEETTVIIKPENLSHIHTMHNLTAGDEWSGVFFKTEKWDGEPKVNEPDKHSEVKWVDLNAVSENIIPYVKQAIEQFQAGNTYSEYGWEK